MGGCCCKDAKVVAEDGVGPGKATAQLIRVRSFFDGSCDETSDKVNFCAMLASCTATRFGLHAVHSPHMQAEAGTAVVVKSDSAVKVAVVVRPLLLFETQKGCTSVVNIDPPNKVIAPWSFLQHTHE